MDREWALGQNGRSFPRWSSLLSTRPALLPWLRLVWKDRSKDDLTKPGFCPEKQRPGHHARPRERGFGFLGSVRPKPRAEGRKSKRINSRCGSKKADLAAAASREGETLCCGCRRRRSSVYEVAVLAVMGGSRRVISALFLRER